MGAEGDEKLAILNEFKERRNLMKAEKGEEDDLKKEPKTRSGDWKCISCSNHNYAFRE